MKTKQFEKDSFSEYCKNGSQETVQVIYTGILQDGSIAQIQILLPILKKNTSNRFPTTSLSSSQILTRKCTKKTTEQKNATKTVTILSIPPPPQFLLLFVVANHPIPKTCGSHQESKPSHILPHSDNCVISIIF